MTPLTWSPRSIADLEAIASFIACDSPAYANIVVRRIVASVARLASFPQSGRIVPEFGRPDLREVIVRPYRVVYRVRQGAVEIATVVHSARVFRHLPEDPAVWEHPVATEARPEPEAPG
ncbi:MAG: type II toxin-antitoxin system RelE/ParE family toxin [Planctomycetota bacterium]